MAIFTGCQTTGRILQTAGSALAPVNSAPADMVTHGRNSIAVNPWGLMGALLFLAGALWTVLTKDRETGLSAMVAGVTMGVIGIAFNHPWAPATSLILVAIGASLAIKKHVFGKWKTS